MNARLSRLCRRFKTADAAGSAEKASPPHLAAPPPPPPPRSPPVQAGASESPPWALGSGGADALPSGRIPADRKQTAGAVLETVGGGISGAAGPAAARDAEKKGEEVPRQGGTPAAGSAAPTERGVDAQGGVSGGGAVPTLKERLAALGASAAPSGPAPATGRLVQHAAAGGAGAREARCP